MLRNFIRSFSLTFSKSVAIISSLLGEVLKITLRKFSWTIILQWSYFQQWRIKNQRKVLTGKDKRWTESRPASRVFLTLWWTVLAHTWVHSTTVTVSTLFHCFHFPRSSLAVYDCPKNDIICNIPCIHPGRDAFCIPNTIPAFKKWWFNKSH